MKDRNGNVVTVGTLMQSIEGGIQPIIECIAISNDLATFEYLDLRGSRQFKMTAQSLANSSWVAVDK